MAKKNYVRDMFNNISGSYDKLNHIMSLDMDKGWRKKAIKRIVDVDKPLNILDLACGTGDFSIAIAKFITSTRGCSYCSCCSSNRKPTSSRITGVDFSEGMLDIMKSKVEAEGLSDVIVVRQGDGEALDFADNTFDRVSIAFGIRNFEDKEKGLKEILRVLKPGGRLVLLELSLPENSLFRWIFNLYFNNILPYIGGVISGNKNAYHYLPQSVSAFPKRSEFMKLMSDCGFKSVAHRAFTFGVCRMYIGEK